VSSSVAAIARALVPILEQARIDIRRFQARIVVAKTGEVTRPIV
jgi:hypothetical protein